VTFPAEVDIQGNAQVGLSERGRSGQLEAEVAPDAGDVPEVGADQLLFRQAALLERAGLVEFNCGHAPADQREAEAFLADFQFGEFKHE